MWEIRPAENPAPILYSEASQVWPPKPIGKYHLKLFLEQKDRMLEGIAFGLGARKHELKGKNLKLKIAFTPHVNMFLKILDVKLNTGFIH